MSRQSPARKAARKSATAVEPPHAEGLRLRARLRYLYHGSSPLAVRFRLAVIVIDFAIIGFFLAAPILHEAGLVFYVVDYIIAAILAADLVARAYAHTDPKDWLKKPATWVDLFVLATLLFPAWLFNFGFLRLLPNAVGDVDQINDGELIRAADEVDACERENEQGEDDEAEQEAGDVAPAPEFDARQAERNDGNEEQEEQQRQRRGKSHRKHSTTLIGLYPRTGVLGRNPSPLTSPLLTKSGSASPLHCVERGAKQGQTRRSAPTKALCWMFMTLEGMAWCAPTKTFPLTQLRESDINLRPRRMLR